MVFWPHIYSNSVVGARFLRHLRGSLSVKVRVQFAIDSDLKRRATERAAESGLSLFKRLAPFQSMWRATSTSGIRPLRPARLAMVISSETTESPFSGGVSIMIAFVCGGNMRILGLLVVLCCPVALIAQVASSEVGCTVSVGGVMACNGPQPGKTPGYKSPILLFLHISLAPGASFDSYDSEPDCLIFGIDGGMLVNELAPFGEVSLRKDSVTLMPRELAYRLRNTTSRTIEFRVAEVRR